MAADCCRENRSRGIADLSRRLEPDLPSESAPAAEASAATEEVVEGERQETESAYFEIETGTDEPKETALEFEEESLGADAFNELAEEDAAELETDAGEMAEEDEFEETTDSAPAEFEAAATEANGEEESSPEGDETDASASHRVDPSSPTGFRLFGFGKKKEEEAAKQRRLRLRFQRTRRAQALWKRK